MPFVVDGSNVGGSLGGVRGSRNREEVLQALLPWARGRRRVILVFDGPEDPRLATAYGRLSLRYSGSRTADTLIRDLVSRGSGWTVVTDDLELSKSCRRWGAQHLGVADLLAQIPPRAEERAGEEVDPRVDVGDWEDFFDRDSS